MPVRRPDLLIFLVIGAHAIAGPSCTPPKVIPLCPGFETVECDTRMLCVVVASDGCRECVCERRWFDDSRDPGVPDPALKAAAGTDDADDEPPNEGGDEGASDSENGDEGDSDDTASEETDETADDSKTGD